MVQKRAEKDFPTVSAWSPWKGAESLESPQQKVCNRSVMGIGDWTWRDGGEHMHLANLYFWPRWSTYSQGMSFHVGSSHKAMSRQRMFGGEENLLDVPEKGTKRKEGLLKNCRRDCVI